MVMTCCASGVGLIPGSNEVTSVPLAATSSAAGAALAAPSQAPRTSAPSTFSRFSRDPLMAGSSAVPPEQPGPDPFAASPYRRDVWQRGGDFFSQAGPPPQALK